jgi:hypothetical protein
LIISADLGVGVLIGNTAIFLRNEFSVIGLDNPGRFAMLTYRTGQDRTGQDPSKSKYEIDNISACAANAAQAVFMQTSTAFIIASAAKQSRPAKTVPKPDCRAHRHSRKGVSANDYTMQKLK